MKRRRRHSYESYSELSAEEGKFISGHTYTFKKTYKDDDGNIVTKTTTIKK